MRELFLTVLMRLALSLGGFLAALFVLTMAKRLFELGGLPDENAPPWFVLTVSFCLLGILVCYLGLVWTSPDLLKRLLHAIPNPPPLP